MSPDDPRTISEITSNGPAPKGQFKPHLTDNLPADWLFSPSFDAHDAKRGITVTVKIPETLADAMSQLIGRPGVPFESHKHILLEGALLALRLTNDRLTHPDPQIIAYVMGQQAARQQRWLAVQHASFYSMVAQLRDNLIEAVNLGDYTDAQRTLTAARRNVAQIAEAHWVKRYTSAIDQLAIVRTLDRLAQKGVTPDA